MELGTDFINSLGLKLTESQISVLEMFAALVWEKKENLNLTSVADKQELWDRHILDGLVAASLIDKETRGRRAEAADYGAGAGYIGITIAAALPNTHVTLVESIEKRCMFMEWALFKTGLKNVTVLNIRAGEANADKSFDFTTERAMGKIDDICHVCTRDLRAGGLFLPYQAAESAPRQDTLEKCSLKEEGVFEYTLPAGNMAARTKRKILLLRKTAK